MQRRQTILILQTVLALVLTQVLVLFAVCKMRALAALLPSTSTSTISAAQLIITFFISSALLFFLVKKLRQRVVFEVLFALTILVGVWSFAELYFPQAALPIAAFAVALRYIIPIAFTQNIVMIIGVAGIAAFLGSAIPWLSMAIVLTILSIYDVVAVYGTHHMVAMFKGLLEKGVIFALIIPEKPKQIFVRLTEVKPGQGFFFLGSGDLILPSLFVASAAREGLEFALGAMAGSIVGLVGTDLLFRLGKGRPMPALPPIALGTLLGFFVVVIAIRLI